MSALTVVSVDNNVHELVFNEASRQAADEFLSMWAALYERNEANMLYIVLDMRDSGMLPLRYLTTQMRDMLQQHPDRESAHIAIVLDDPQILSVTQALMRTIIRRQRVQYFTQMDKAYFWLEIEKKKARQRQ